MSFRLPRLGRMSRVIRGNDMVQQPPARPDSRKLGGGAIATIGGGAVLLIFIIQNRDDVGFDFLWFSFTWPLWLYTIVTAVFGALVWLGLGILRRHRRRKERRAERRD
jgi:uncharacterized integral membrane protein